MTQQFTHLHVHSQYSLLDGQASIKALVDKAKGNGMKGIALTDHGSMFGVKEFYNYVSKQNKGVFKEIKGLKSELKKLTDSVEESDAKAIANLEQQILDQENKLFKPIIGCEMYVAPRGMEMKEGRPDQGGYHLVVLAKDKVGYHNLIKLVSKAWTDGFYMRPRTDREQLEKYREGLIVSSACLGGEIPRRIRENNLDEARDAIRWFQQVFGDDFYIELQRHKATVPRANHETYLIQQKTNEQLIALAREFDVKIICTNDVHFVSEEHAEAHDRLICLSTGRDLDDPERMLYSKQEWLKTREEMCSIFQDIPEAIDNTMEIFDKVEYYSIDHAPIMPTFDIPESFGTEEEYKQKYSHEDLYNEFTQNEKGEIVLSESDALAKVEQLGGYERMYRLKLEADYLKELTYVGAKKIYGDPLSDEVIERLEFELYIMKTMGFPGYFLIVQDFINVARDELNVSVGPGRGSAAGSAVAYCLGITRIDPIKYDLLFERFLNPDRISLPDIDVDFDDDGRGDVLKWVTEKYGQEKVAHIITYGTMAAKMALRDVARVQKLPLSEAERLAKLIPDRIPGKKITLPNAIEYVPELKEAESSSDPLVRDTIKYAKLLEGNVRNTGVHACGTIICRDDITDWVPVSTADDKSGGEKLLVTQYEGSVIEDTGLIKMDFLGLKTLSILKEAIANIKQSKGVEIDIEAIPIDDPATYKLYSEGKTVGTFQFESAGMQKYLKELQPTVFEDLIAMNALYRPGPMDYIPDFVDRKHGRKPIVYDIPIMEKYLKETYGITVYQEQVMLLSRLLANFTRGESDTLRKAMGKKLHDTLNYMKPKFISGGKKNGYDSEVLEKIWGDWEKFASYAFNKSHATCYSWIAYQTAYLKANYPAEYMAAVLSRNINNITEITKFMDECRAMGILVLGPDVNESLFKFNVNAEGNIRFGIGAIKGVGEKAVKAIIEERMANGEFKDIFDFIQRVNLTDCTRKNIENLALAGAFDNFQEIKREQFFSLNEKGEMFLETLVRYGTKYQEDQRFAGASLFGDNGMVEIATPEIPTAEKWSDLERLNKERELVGIYLSAHPLDDYSVLLDYACNTHMAQLDNLNVLLGKDLTLGGMVTGVRRGVSRNGSPYGFAKIEDFSGSFEIPFWGKDWVEFQGFLSEGMFLYIQAKCQERGWGNRDPEIKVGSIQLLPDVKDELIEKITINIPLEELNSTLITELSTIIKKNPGKCELFFKVVDTESNIDLTLFSSPIRLAVEKELLQFIELDETLSFTIN